MGETINIKKPINKDSLIILIVVGALVLITAIILCYYFLFQGKTIVATYNTGNITRDKYELYYRAFAPVLTYYGYPTNVAVEYIADKIVLDDIIMKKATEEGYEITEEEKADVEETFKNETLIEQYTSYGVDLDDLKDLFYKDTIISRYIEELEKKVTEDQIKAYIDENEGDSANYNIYKTRHILISATSSSTEEELAAAQTKAQEALNKALAGEDFVTLVQTYSEDTSTTGDDAGIVNATTSNVVEEYSNAVLTMTEGQIYATLVKSSYGYHIIKLEEIQTNGRLTSEDEKSNVVNEQLATMQEEENIKYKDALYIIAKTIGVELGIVEETDEVTRTATEELEENTTIVTPEVTD